LSRDSALRKNSQIGRGFGTIVLRKRLEKSLKASSKEALMRTWPLSVRQGREKGRFPARRVIVMEVHHSQG